MRVVQVRRRLALSMQVVALESFSKNDLFFPVCVVCMLCERGAIQEVPFTVTLTFQVAFMLYRQPSLFFHGINIA